MTWGRRFRLPIFIAVALTIAAFYRWEVRSAGYDFQWGHDDLNGYYNLLARGFAGGHLYLPIEPLPQLLAQPNPWDPKVDDTLKLFDAALFNKHYYLYHGPGPAVMLFLPYLLITHHDLPENYALYIFCLFGYLFSAATLLYLARPGPIVLTLMLLALGLCQCVPFLLSRVWVYELAIGAGYFCLSAAMFFFVRNWSFPAGLMFGIAVSCRPHFILAGLIALGATCFLSRRRAIGFAIPFVLAGLSIAFYNQARFGNPVEFGNDYMLTGANMGKLKPSFENLTPGLFYMLLAPPDFGPVFPFVKAKSPPPSVARPAGYIVEPIIGSLWLAPFALFGFFAGKDRPTSWVLLLSSLAILIFITLTGWSTQRYAVDYLPAALLVAFTCVPKKALVALVPLVLFGMVVNMALGISGPLDEMLKNRPARYVKIAGWFSPIARYRPQLNPPLSLDIGRNQWLRVAGQYDLHVESGKLISHGRDSTLSSSVAPDLEPFHLTYTPDSGVMRITGDDGRELIAHRIGPIVTAPAQITVTSPGL